MVSKKTEKSRSFRSCVTGLVLTCVGLFVVGVGCAGVKNIPGTQIRDNPQNRALIRVVEKYRRAMIRRDMGALMAMAHPHYYEHGGTHKGDDDYGYKGLLHVIKKRISQLETLRYMIKYRRVKWISSTQVEVEVYIDASFQLKLIKGQSKWSTYADYNKLVLIKHKDRWLLIRGM